MAGNILSAVINVTAPGAKEAFNEVAKSTIAVNDSLKQLGAQGVLNTRSVADAMVKLKTIISNTSDPAELQKLRIAFAALQDKAKDLPPVFDKVQAGSLRASSAAINLTHSLGLMPAEASHLTHGIESILFSFENLRAQTGSTSEAMKGLAGTIGAGLGIGLAITFLSSLIEKLFDTDEGLKVVEAQFDRVKDSIDGMNSSLKSLEEDLGFLREIGKLRAEIGGAKGPGLEIIDLNQLKRNNQVIKETITEDLKEINEKITNGLASVAAITKAKGIDFAFTKEGLIPKSVVDEQDKTVKKFFETVNELIKEKNTLDEKLIKNNQETATSDQKITVETNKAIEEANKKRIEDYKKYLKGLKEQLDFEDGLLKLQADHIKKIFDQKFNSVDVDQKLRIKIGIDINKDLLATEFGPKEQEISKGLQKEIERLTKNNPILIRANAKIELTPDQKALEVALENIKQIIKDAFNDSIANIGEVIGTALSGGDIGKAFQQFGNIIGSAVQAIGKQLIALGTAALLAKNALKTLFANPAVEIAAGVALVAVGAALKNILGGGIKGFAGGGYTGAGGRNDPAGIVHKGEFVMPDFAVQKLGVGYLNNLAFGNNIKGYADGGFVSGGGISGGLGLNIGIEVRQQGDQLIGFIDYMHRKQGRLG